MFLYTDMDCILENVLAEDTIGFVSSLPVLTIDIACFCSVSYILGGPHLNLMCE